MLATLSRESAAYGVRLTPGQTGRFETYLSLLADWSQRVNLVGNVDAEVVQRRHFLESIALGAALREREILRPGATVLDVGAGAGVPGVQRHWRTIPRCAGVSTSCWRGRWRRSRRCSN